MAVYRRLRRVRSSPAGERTATNPPKHINYGSDGSVGALRFSKLAPDLCEAGRDPPASHHPNDDPRLLAGSRHDKRPEVKGIISWNSIGSRLALERPCNTVRECMETAEIVSIEESLFSAIEKVATHDYVLVQAKDKSISGIVTASDFNDRFRRLAEPFLLVGKVENGVRRILHGKLTSRELEEVKAPSDDQRTIGAVSDRTFGEYIRLIESEKGWR